MRALSLLLVTSASIVVPDGGVVPAGQRLIARMNRSIGTRSSLGPGRFADVTAAGGEFGATIESAIVDPQGQTRLAAGAIVQGHVVSARPGLGLERGVLELAVDRLDRRPLSARIISVDVQQVVSMQPELHAYTLAFWGAMVGGISFGIPGVVLGYYGSGSAAGIHVARARRTDAWISAGSLITLELTAPLPLDRCVAARDVMARC
jgi:hypothetical protein